MCVCGFLYPACISRGKGLSKRALRPLPQADRGAQRGIWDFCFTLKPTRGRGDPVGWVLVLIF